MKKIERPTLNICAGSLQSNVPQLSVHDIWRIRKTFQAVIDVWFDENIEPINQMLDDGQVVYSEDEDIWSTTDSYFCNNTYKALLVGIEPIKKESAEDVLREIYQAIDNRCIVTDDVMMRAKKSIGEREITQVLVT